MKGRHLLILLALVLIVGGAGYYLQTGNQSSWSSSGGGAGGKVLEFPINDVATARIKTKDAEVHLTRKGDGWTVRERGDYSANFDQVSGLLRKAWDLKTVQEVKVGPSQMPRLDLVEPGKGENSGSLLEFQDKDGKNLAALLLGKKHFRKGDAGPMGGEGFPTGRYVMPVGGNKVSLVSDTFDDADPKPERWLRKDFLKVETPLAISVNGQTETMRWKITRDSATAEWKLAEAKPEETLDTTKVGSLGSLFASPTFKDVLAADAKPEETGLDKPTTVTIETGDAFTYTAKIGKLTNEAYPVLFNVAANIAKERTPAADEKPEDKTRLDTEFQAKQKRLEEKLATEKKFEGRAYLLEKFTIDPLLKDRTALLAEKKPDPATTSTPPPAAPGTPPISVTTPPVTVTTPPVSVPPAPTTPPADPAKPSPAPAPATPPADPAPSPSALPPTTPPAPPPTTPPAPLAPADPTAPTPTPPPPAPPTPAPPSPESPPATPPAAPPEPRPAPEPAPANPSPAPAPPAETPPPAPPAPEAPQT